MKRKTIIAAAVVAALVVALLIIWGAVGEDRFDEDPDTAVRPSGNLERDKRLMWKLVEMETRDQTGQVTYLVSPVSAINAASRVMESEKSNLVGLTQEEVLRRLNHDESHRRGSYNFPFFSLAKDERAIVLRFDCGRFGWQFDLLTDDSGKVREVRRRWIH